MKKNFFVTTVSFYGLFSLYFIYFLASCSSPSVVTQRQYNHQKPRDLQPSSSVKAVKIDEYVFSYDQKIYEYYYNHYNKKEEYFQKLLSNASKYKEFIQETLTKEGLPSFLFYIGLIESHYNLKIQSHAGAKGPWQFMKTTAKAYNLQIGHGVDERNNIFFSTVAALKHLKYLYHIFGKWELALLAYNAGEFRIIGAIKKGHTRDYLALFAKGLLPKETFHYIPKMIAAIRMAKMVDEMPLKRSLALPKSLVLVKAKRPFHVQQIIETQKIDKELFFELNAHLQSPYIKAFEHFPVKILLPQMPIKSYLTSLQHPVSIKHKQILKKKLYTVKKGDNLYSIAQKFNVALQKIKKENQLETNKVFPGQKLKIVLATNP